MPLRSLAATCVILALFAAPGCHKKSGGTTVVSGNDIFTTDDFPGDAVQNGNVADDQRAMSPSGEDATFPALFINGDRGTSIVVYQMDAGTLVAHHYDGDSWTPPVTLVAQDCQPATAFSVDAVSVAWINTENHDSQNAQDRDGDAVIIWMAEDIDGDGAADPDGENRCLYLTYFNVDSREEIASNYGFQPLATRLNAADNDAEDVQSAGFVSDGLQGEARWGFIGGRYTWGDDTTGITVVWLQRESNDGASGFEDRALHARRLVLDAVVPDDLPLTPGAGMEAEIRLPILAMNASDTGLSSEETQVDNFFVVYNNVMIFRVTARNIIPGIDDVDAELEDDTPGFGGFDGVADDTDQVLQALRIDPVTGTVSTPVVLHTGVPDATDAIANDAYPISESFGAHYVPAGLCYGSDEGLAALVFWSFQLANDADGMISAATSGRLAMSELDESTGALLSHTLGGVDDPTVDDTPVLGGARGMICRNGDSVFVVHVEQDGRGASNDYAILASSYVTTRIPEDGSVPVLPATSASWTIPAPVNADLDGSSAYYWAFQRNLGYRCGIQSDPDVVNIVFEHSDVTRDELFVARLTASPVLPASLAAAVTSVDTEDDTPAGNWRGSSVIGEVNDDPRFCSAWGALDSGEGGNVVVVYRKDVIAGMGTEYHLFARRTGASPATIRIDSNIPEKRINLSQFRLFGTPSGSEIGAFDPASAEDDERRPNPLQVLHVLFHETESTPFPGIGFALRTRRFHAEAAAAAFGDTWTPSAGAVSLPPTDLDLPGINTSSSAASASVKGFFTCGNAVGIYFQQLDHLYYQEYEGEAEPADFGWLEDDGSGNPILVDDDSSEEVVGGIAVYPGSTSCCGLEGSKIFWLKEFENAPGIERLQVRVRD